MNNPFKRKPKHVPLTMVTISAWSNDKELASTTFFVSNELHYNGEVFKLEGPSGARCSIVLSVKPNDYVPHPPSPGGWPA